MIIAVNQLDAKWFETARVEKAVNSKLDSVICPSDLLRLVHFQPLNFVEPDPHRQVLPGPGINSALHCDDLIRSADFEHLTSGIDNPELLKRHLPKMLSKLFVRDHHAGLYSLKYYPSKVGTSSWKSLSKVSTPTG
jgi:hypothetical protein